MAVVFQKEGSFSPHPTAAPKSQVDVSGLTLPTAKHVPSKELSSYKLFIYGEKKIGKSTLCSMFPDALHILTEPGGEGIESYQRTINYWEEFVKYVDLLSTDTGAAFKNVVIDTIDVLYKRCFTFVCLREGMEHPGDVNDWGKSWDKIKDEFISQIDRLCKSGKGVIVLSHAKETEIKTLHMGNWTKIVPTLAGGGLGYISAAFDLIGYYGYFQKERYLVIEGHEALEGGRRKIGGGFHTPEGKRITAIPMGMSETEAFENLIAAFRNEQEDTYDFVTDTSAEMTDLAATIKLRKQKH